MKKFQNYKVFFKMLCFSSTLLGVSLITTNALSSCSPANEKKYIFDVDTGLDDARALYISLTNGIEIVGIICTGGNTTVEHSIKNTIWILKQLNRLDIPIYQGFSSNKTSDNYFGPYGFGNIDESMITDDDYKNVHTSEKELDNFVKKYRNSIYVCTAPKTTIAKYLNYFDCIYSMGGTIYATGNVYEPSTGTYFEFNQWFDLNAYSELMESNHVISNVYLDQCFSVSKESAIALYDNEIMTTLITSQPSDDLFYADELVAFSILNN